MVSTPSSSRARISAWAPVRVSLIVVSGSGGGLGGSGSRAGPTKRPSGGGSGSALGERVAQAPCQMRSTRVRVVFMSSTEYRTGGGLGQDGRHGRAASRRAQGDRPAGETGAQGPPGARSQGGAGIAAQGGGNRGRRAPPAVAGQVAGRARWQPVAQGTAGGATRGPDRAHHRVLPDPRRELVARPGNGGSRVGQVPTDVTRRGGGGGAAQEAGHNVGAARRRQGRAGPAPRRVEGEPGGAGPADRS